MQDHKSKIVRTKKFSLEQAKQINELWNNEYPINLKDRFPLLLQGIEKYNHYVIEDINNNVIAWAVDFERENAAWFSVIVDAKHQGKKLGQLLIEKLKSENTELYGWVIDHENDIKTNNEFYKTPIPFYLKLGFEILPEFRIETDIISAVKVKWTNKNDI